MRLRRRTTGISTRQQALLLSQTPSSRPVSPWQQRLAPRLPHLRRVYGWVKRWLFVILITLFVGWVMLMNELRVVALGAIDAPVFRVAAAFPAQIQSVAVTCDARVEAGTPMAVVRNEIMLQQYRTDFARVEAEFNQARSVYDARVAAVDEAASAAQHEHRAATKVRENVALLRGAMEPLWQKRQITLTEWLEIDNSWLKAMSTEAAAEANWRSRQAEARKTRLEMQEQIAGLQARLTEIGKLVEISGHHQLLAGTSGVITRCDRKPGEVVASGEPILEIQQSGTPSVVAYVSASDMDRVRPGMVGLVFLATEREPLAATVEKLPVQVGRLPGRLKRYFWQGQEWQQYAPVKLSLGGLPPGTAERLRNNERVDILFEMFPRLHLPVWILNVF